MMMFTFRRPSSFWISLLFSFSRNEATSTGTWACTAPVFSFIASSCMMRRTCSAVDSVPRMKPVPLQRGQLMCAVSSSEGCRRWRELHQAEARDLADLHPRPVVAQRLAQAVLDLTLVALRL